MTMTIVDPVAEAAAAVSYVLLLVEFTIVPHLAIAFAADRRNR